MNDEDFIMAGVIGLFIMGVLYLLSQPASINVQNQPIITMPLAAWIAVIAFLIIIIIAYFKSR